MKYLSKDFIDLSKVSNEDVDFNGDILPKMNWNDCPVVAVDKYGQHKCTFIHFKSKNVVPIIEKHEYRLRKIEKGILKNYYTMIMENNNNYDRYYIFVAQKKKFMLLPITISTKLTIDELDDLFSSENIQKITAQTLHTYEAGSGYQAYQSLCDLLPKKCFLDENFKNEVLNQFEKMGEVKIITDNYTITPIDEKKCRQEAKDYFLSLYNEKGLDK